MRRLEAIFGLVAAVAGCAVTAALAAAISSGALPADKPGALFFQAVGFTAFLAVGLGAALHAAETPASPVGVALLWLGTVIAGLLTMLGALSIGICLLPGTALAVAASLVALLRVPDAAAPPEPTRLAGVAQRRCGARRGPGGTGRAALLGVDLLRRSRQRRRLQPRRPVWRRADAAAVCGHHRCWAWWWRSARRCMPSSVLRSVARCSGWPRCCWRRPRRWRSPESIRFATSPSLGRISRRP